jgi:hypothetical protein
MLKCVMTVGVSLMNNQEMFYVYKLARVNDKTSYHFVDADFDGSISEEAVYYGITRDPKDRLSKHRPGKGQDIALIVLGEFTHAERFFGLEYEAWLVAEHIRKYGSKPELQGESGLGNYGYKYGGNK